MVLRSRAEGSENSLRSRNYDCGFVLPTCSLIMLVQNMSAVTVRRRQAVCGSSKMQANVSWQRAWTPHENIAVLHLLL